MIYSKRFDIKNAYAPIIAFIVGVSLVVVNIIRVIQIPITIDETGVRADDTYVGLMINKIGSANNHILHSLFRKFFIDTFGDNIFTIRLDSLIAQFFYLFFSYAISNILFKKKGWVLGAFIMLNVASPLIFNFWGLSRGYALALTFMLVSVYYFLKYIVEQRLFLILISFALAILSVYSNFGYINYFITLCALVVFQHILFGRCERNIGLVKELVVIFIAACVLTLLIIVPLRNVYGHGELSFLGSKGFIQDTVVSLVTTGVPLFGDRNLTAVYAITTVVITLAGLSAIFWTYTYFKKRAHKENTDSSTKYGITLFLLLIVPVASLCGQHVLFGINYLTDRTAIFFIIIFLLQLIYLLYYITPKQMVFSYTSFIAIFLIIVINFLSRLNIHSTVLWYFDEADLGILKKIDNETKDRPGIIKVAVSWPSEPAIKWDMEHFYPGRFNPPISISHTKGKDTTFDYYYITVDDVPKLPDGYIRDTDCVGGSFILLRKKSLLPPSK